MAMYEIPFVGSWDIPADLEDQVGKFFDDISWRFGGSFSPVSFAELFQGDPADHAPLPFPLEPAFVTAALVFSGDATSPQAKELATEAAIRQVARALICIMYPGSPDITDPCAMLDMEIGG